MHRQVKDPEEPAEFGIVEQSSVLPPPPPPLLPSGVHELPDHVYPWLQKQLVGLELSPIEFGMFAQMTFWPWTVESREVSMRQAMKELLINFMCVCKYIFPSGNSIERVIELARRQNFAKVKWLLLFQKRTFEWNIRRVWVARRCRCYVFFGAQ